MATEKKLSGTDWCGLFLQSNSTSGLELGFKTKVDAFIKALRDAGASVSISTTLRPPKRVYLMHYAYKVSKGIIAPDKVPLMDGVNIDWVHRDESGEIDIEKSKEMAKEMTKKYGIVYPPSLTSNHVKGLAIDMSIFWSGTLKIKNKQGKDISIGSHPRSGSNKELHEVGKTYGVLKLVSDPPHWSYNGH